MKFRMRSPSLVRASAHFNDGGTSAPSTTLDAGMNFRTIGTTGTAA